MSTATAATYQGTFGGRAAKPPGSAARSPATCSDCPVTEDIVLIAHELAANAIVHTHSRGESFARPLRSVPRDGPGRGRGYGRAVAAPQEPTTGPTGWTSSRPSPAPADGEPAPPAPEHRLTWARLSW